MKKVMGVFLVLGLICGFAGAASADLTSGLVAYWPFNGNANDESGNGHDGTVLGATLAADRLGNSDSAYSFDGGDWIDVPDDPSLTIGTDPFTFGAWIQFSSDGGYYLMGHSTGGGDYNKWILYTSNNSIYLIVYPGPSWTYIAPADFQVGKWYHVAVRGDLSNATAFVDGSPVGSVPFTYSMPDPSAPLQIGSAEYASGHPERRFRGLIDEVRIYRRALSAEEICGLAECGSGPCVGSSAEASTYVASPVLGSNNLVRHLAWLLLPIGAVIGLMAWRRRT